MWCRHLRVQDTFVQVHCDHYHKWLWSWHCVLFKKLSTQDFPPTDSVHYAEHVTSRVKKTFSGSQLQLSNVEQLQWVMEVCHICRRVDLMFWSGWHAAAKVHTETLHWPRSDVSRGMLAGRQWERHVMVHRSAAHNMSGIERLIAGMSTYVAGLLI